MEWVIDPGLIENWLLGLDDSSYAQIQAALELLAEYGPNLGRPLVDTISGSNVKNLKELRPGSTGRTENRVLFAFDPAREAILLVAGSKAGKWKRWYRESIPIAESCYTEHLRLLEGS